MPCSNRCPVKGIADRLGLALVSLLCLIVMDALVPRAHAADAEADQAWEKLRVKLALEQQAIRSREYRFIMRGFPGVDDGLGLGPMGSSMRQLSYWEQGDRYRLREEIRVERGKLEDLWDEVILSAFDGDFCRSRFGSRPGILMIGASQCSTYGAAGKLERNLTAFSHQQIEAARREGEVQIMEVAEDTFEGQRAIRLKCLHGSTDVASTHWFLPAKGYVLVKGEGVDRHGMRVMTTEVTDIAEVRGEDGQIFYFPVKGRLIVWNKGQRAGGFEVEVDRESIRFNHEIPPFVFQLKRLPEEEVYDRDLRMTVPADPRDAQIPATPETLEAVPSAKHPYRSQLPVRSGVCE